MSEIEPQSVPANSHKIRLSIDLRLIVLGLIVVIAIMLFVWKPWAQTPSADGRTVTVSGEASIKAEPDQFVFYPSYEFKDANKDVALANVAKKSDEITKKLKELGVPENKIKNNSNGYENYSYFQEGLPDKNTYSLSLTITLDKRDLTQKVQDYLITTSPSGQITPQPGFSEVKRKGLEGQARDAATKDARTKADQSAKNLGFKVGKVKSIEDGANFGGPIPYAEGGVNLDVEGVSAKTTQLRVQPGENDLMYSVKVVYYIN